MDWQRALAEQLSWHWHAQLRPRLEGLTDDEYFWQPAPGCWTLRPVGEPSPDGANLRAESGAWALDFGHPEPSPAPVTTIAWRMAHLIVGVFGARNHSYFGGAPVSYETFPYAATAGEALAQLDEQYARWIDGVRNLTDEQLAEPVGDREFEAFAHLPIADLVLHIHREVIHHGAEISLLRNLWAHRR